MNEIPEQETPQQDIPRQAPEPKSISIKEFLEAAPPGRFLFVRDMTVKESRAHPGSQLILPSLQLHCGAAACAGIRFFEPAPGQASWLSPQVLIKHFAEYVCRNCGHAKKIYALLSRVQEDGINGVMFKFGENPPFGPPTPARVISLIGPEKDYYLKGRRAESQGLGIAAFAYYRRAVENQKGRILDEIIKVSQKLNAPSELLDELTAAKTETRFSQAVEAVKHGIPQALLINGHNPLTLLHHALSGGLHDHTDEQCLELATSIRVILTELVERLASALKEEAS